jgi:integration host factor subunit beta
LTKSQLIDEVAARAGLTRKRAEALVHTIFDSMEEALRRGDRIEIRGFGSFRTKHYGAYTGRNPKTGEPIEVGAKVLPVFKVGRELRERVEGSSSACRPGPGLIRGAPRLSSAASPKPRRSPGASSDPTRALPRA